MRRRLALQSNYGTPELTVDENKTDKMQLGRLGVGQAGNEIAIIFSHVNRRPDLPTVCKVLTALVSGDLIGTESSVSLESCSLTHS